MCCASFLKIMMFIFNGGIFLAGAVILGVGIWVQVDSGSFLDILEEVEDASSLSQLVNVSYVLIAVGAVLLVIGFLGCCGAIRENKCMLLTFFSIVLIIFLIEVAGAIVLFVFKDVAGELLQEVEEKVQKSIEMNYGNKEKEKLTSVWDNTMKEFKCCGYRNYTDFTGSPFYNNGGKSLYPAPCCNSTTSADECNAERAGEANVNGCFDKLLQLIEDNALVIAGVAMGIAALEIAAMVVSMVLYCKAKKDR